MYQHLRMTWKLSSGNREMFPWRPWKIGMAITRNSRVQSLLSTLSSSLRAEVSKELSCLSHWWPEGSRYRAVVFSFGEERLSGSGGHDLEVIILHEAQMAGPPGLSEVMQSSPHRRKQCPKKVGQDRCESWSPCHLRFHSALSSGPSLGGKMRTSRV